MEATAASSEELRFDRELAAEDGPGEAGRGEATGAVAGRPGTGEEEATIN